MRVNCLAQEHNAMSPARAQTRSARSGVERTNSRGGGGTPYNGLYGEAPPERGTFFRLQVYERVGISHVEVYKRVGNRSFRYLKGSLIITFRIDAPYGCISLFIKVAR